MAKKHANKSNVTKLKSMTTASSFNTKEIAKSFKKVSDYVNNMPIIGYVVAEFIGVFLLTAAFIYMQGSPLFFAFAYMGATLLVSGVSGAHLNPAITIGAFATRKIGAINAFFYIIAQVLGAVVAWIVVNAFLQGSAEATSNTAKEVLHAGTIPVGREWYLFFSELLGVTIIATGVATAIGRLKDKLLSAFTVGFAVVIALYIALSQTSPLLIESNTIFSFLNPAIAAAGTALSWEVEVWPLAIYILAPVLGGIAGFLISDFLRSQSTK